MKINENIRIIIAWLPIVAILLAFIFFNKIKPETINSETNYHKEIE